MAVASVPSLCPKGVWMTVEDAIKHFGIKKNVMKMYKNGSCPMNMHFEHGRYVKAPMPYEGFQFVYISPENTSPLFGDITLRNWSKMCDYFSNNSIQSDDDVDKLFGSYFHEYTTLPATHANVTAAFDAGVLKRSSQLKNVPRKGKGKGSKSNANNNTNNNNNQSANKNQQQKKKEDEEVINLIPSKGQLTKEVEKRYKQLRPEEEESDKVLSQLGGLMKIAEIDSITFQANRKKATKPTEVNIIFTLCGQCGCHRINEVRKNQSQYCRACTKKKSKEKKYEQRRKDHAEMRVAPDSDVPMSSLQDDEVPIRMGNLKRDRDVKALALKRLVEKLTKCEIELEKMSDEMRQHSKKSLQFANDNPDLLRNELARTLFDLIDKENESIDGSVPLSREDVGPLVQMLTDEIKNQCRVWNNQKNRCRYSSKNEDDQRCDHECNVK
eukprot:scaffold26689_cov72-Skeletonema_dohrnii-CCMP3373.AAC.3